MMKMDLMLSGYQKIKTKHELKNKNWIKPIKKIKNKNWIKPIKK